MSTAMLRRNRTGTDEVPVRHVDQSPSELLQRVEELARENDGLRATIGALQAELEELRLTQAPKGRKGG